MNTNDFISRKRKLLFKNKEGVLKSAIACPEHISGDGKFIHFGDYFGDEITGWYAVSDALESVVSVLKEFD